MSTRSLGMMGKTYRSASEAFKDADYATAIQRPQESSYEGFGALMMTIMFLVVFAYGFWKTIGL